MTPTPHGQVPEALNQLFEKLEDCIYEWSNYVRADDAPTTLPKYTAGTIKDLRVAVAELYHRALRTTHVQNPAEIEHVAGDVSKNGAESDVAQQPAPSAAAAGQRRSDLVPGVMHCAKCKFQLNRVTLCVSDGNAYAGNNETEPCPNGCGPLWPVTWEQEARNCWKALEEMHERLHPAPTTQADSQPALDRDRIREIFMAHGFTVKEGQTDLKQYVYDAADALLRTARAQADSVCYDYAKQIAESMWATHYKADAPHWESCDSLMGVLSQISNMMCGLSRAPADSVAAPAATPTAASIAWTALRDLTDPLGEAGVKIMGHVRIYAQRQYEAGLTEGRATPPAQAADSVLEDAARLDWLDQQCEAYGFQDIHEGNRWEISGPYANVRVAIDAERAARKQGANHDNS